MTDLNINIALARAMGWEELSQKEWFYSDKTGFHVCHDEVQCSYGLHAGSQTFDYRDPVIFAAICKRWALIVRHDAVYCFVPTGHAIYADTIEKAAALCVIDAAKRGVK